MGDQEGRSFIEQARRAQIIGCAVETLAEVGYRQTSLARIAKRAGISTGVISYHFAGKDALMQAVLDEVFERGRAFMEARVQAQTTSMGMLRVHIESNLAFLQEYPAHRRAAGEIVLNARGKDGELLVDVSAFGELQGALERCLRDGQESGEFVAFDPAVMAATIRAGIDAAVGRLAMEPELDLAAYGRELTALFERATAGNIKTG
jgi:AcrR family transcriptional regulator